MGVKVREKDAGSGIYWIFINHQGRRTSRRVGSEAAAMEVARQVEARLTLGELGLLDNTQRTFKDVADEWLASNREWKRSTKITYQANLSKHILPVFGKRPIAQIQRLEIKKWMDTKAIHYRPGMLRILRAALSGVFIYAMDIGLIKASPVDHISIKEKRRYDSADPLTDAESEKLLEAAKVFMGGFYYRHLLFALRTGVRAGELLALRWDKVDLDARTASIEATTWRGNTDRPKNSKIRRVNLSPQVVDALQAVSQKRGLVFVNGKGTPLHIETLRNALMRCLKAAGLRTIRIHDLRHSYATMRLLRGHDPWDVSKQLGHSSIQMTYDIYGHWIPSKFKAQTDSLDSVCG